MSDMKSAIRPDFTKSDVALLRSVAGLFINTQSFEAQRLREIATRIEALLPPEGK